MGTEHTRELNLTDSLVIPMLFVEAFGGNMNRAAFLCRLLGMADKDSGMVQDFDTQGDLAERYNLTESTMRTWMDELRKSNVLVTEQISAIPRRIRMYIDVEALVDWLRATVSGADAINDEEVLHLCETIRSRNVGGSHTLTLKATRKANPDKEISDKDREVAKHFYDLFLDWAGSQPKRVDAKYIRDIRVNNNWKGMDQSQIYDVFRAAYAFLKQRGPRNPATPEGSLLLGISSLKQLKEKWDKLIPKVKAHYDSSKHHQQDQKQVQLRSAVDRYFQRKNTTNS